ncbi:MAG TPA: hypothetical protein G4O16_10610 [Dehalococcoidia bacterium]|nr:hypothetical protein [Dehalococcoidia bacterium]
MEKKVLDWLLEGPAWLKYAVELQLFDIKPDVRPVLKDSAIKGLILRLQDSNVGIPALKSGKVHYTETGKAYWDLFILADVGLTFEDIRLSSLAEDIFRFQQPDSSFVIPPNVRDNYFCMSAILISSLARMGYRDDPRIDKYIRLAMNSQSRDGGWYCYYYGYEPDVDSCPMDNLNLLMLLGQYEKYRQNPKLNGAIDLLLDHWENRMHLHGFGIGRRFSSLQYPAVKYGILRVLDVLSLFSYAVDSRSFWSMFDFVKRKAVDGRYTAEMTDNAYADFDFAQKQQPSRWLTFLINRIEKRVEEAG